MLLLELINHDWDISWQIINDRDCKFLFSFWWTIFKRLNTKLLIFTVYHSQIDDQCKQTNQIVEITLHYYLTLNSDKVFIIMLLYLQSSLNNLKTFTKYVSNEFAYDFCTNDTLSTLINLLSEDYTWIHQIYYEEAEKSLVFVNVTVKFYYD